MVGSGHSGLVLHICRFDSERIQGNILCGRSKGHQQCHLLPHAATQRAKNGKVAATQPPSTAQVGADHDKLGGQVTAEAVIKMKHEDFVKLPDAELARLRGDEL